MLSEFPFLYRFTVLLKSGGSSSLWSEFWSEFPHFMGMGVVPAPSKNRLGCFSAVVNVGHLAPLYVAAENANHNPESPEPKKTHKPKNGTNGTK